MVALALALAALGLAACTSSGASVSGSSGSTGVIDVVAGENFWGSLASQLGGDRVHVVSILTDPNADPHEYESNTADARSFSAARYVILNGAGYDDWGQKLLDANPVPDRKVLTVANLLGKHPGDNPHFWYDPDYVSRVVDQITADYKAIDGADAAYFGSRHAAFETALRPYFSQLSSIRQNYAGTPVGATESIFVYLAGYLGLHVVSPTKYMGAVAEGNDPPAASVAEFNTQIASRQVRVLVFNSQTVNSVTTNARTLASGHGIPVVGISETVQPPQATFQAWQTAQLKQLARALGSASPSR